MGEFRMPSLGADMDAGTLVEWRVKPGDTVARGDIVALVETQKGIVEVEIWEGGVVESLVVEPGTRVPVGTVLATLSGGAPAVTPAAGGAPAPAPSEAPTPAPAQAAVSPAVAPSTESHVRASPAARQLAREREVDIASVRGTGPHGAVTREDVERASPARVAEPATPRPPAAAQAGAAQAAMRQAIAAAMSRSKREIPHYYLSTDVDVSRALAWLERENAARTVNERVLLAALLLKATALAIHDVPEVNGFYLDGTFRPSEGVHLGVAISLRQGGLVAPAIHDVDQKPLVRVMSDLRDLTARARAGTLRSSEMSDPTLTVTNLGDLGVTSVFGVIFPPQVALVGFGKVAERPWAEGGMVGARPVLTATLAADHRASDGHRGGVYLAAIAKHLLEPERL